MRTLFTFLLSGLIIANAHAQVDPSNNTSGAMITFASQVYDYGKIPKAGNGECVFTYANTGNAPLVITSCKSSCGCVVASYDREPLPPGKSSVVRVRYDTNRPGPFTKTVTVESNAINTPILVLRITGKVLPPMEEMPSDTLRSTDH